MAKSKPADTSKPSPTARKRAAYFVIGALLGGFIGYGFVNAGPEAPPSLLQPYVAAWIFGLGAVCGILGAIAPDTFWRRSRYFSPGRPED